MFVDDDAREINLKVVYWGPGLTGKTTSMQQIYYRVPPERRSKLVSLATETERTLSFHFAVSAKQEHEGYGFRAHLYTVPGPVFYDTSRKLILKGASSVIFVADSMVERAEANSESMENLFVCLDANGLDAGRLVMALQLNKRDLPSAMPVAQMEEDLNPRGWRCFSSVAARGEGVLEPFQWCLAQMVSIVKTVPLARLPRRPK